jgi:hypothetical protein
MVSLTVQRNELQVHATVRYRAVSPVDAEILQVMGQRDPHVGSFGTIPADILCTIAQYASTPLRNLVLVCKRWRAIVLFAPFLWTDIYIEFPSRKMPPGAPTPERLARAALRRAGRTTKLSLHLKNCDLEKTVNSVTAVLGMIRTRGYQFIRKLTLEGLWDFTSSPKFVLPRLAGTWESLLHLDLEASDIDVADLSLLVNCIETTAPALQHIRIKADVLHVVERKLSTKPSLTNLDISQSFINKRPHTFSVWRSIKSLTSHATGFHNSPTGNPIDLQAKGPASAVEGNVFAFPSLTRATFINHTLKFRSTPSLESLTDLVLSYVDIEAVAPRSVEIPSLRRLVADNTRGIDCIIAPMLENLSIGPLREPVGVSVTDYLSKLFSGHPQQLDPVHLDLRGIYTWYDMELDTTVPLISLYYLRRVERISVARLYRVHKSDQWRYWILLSAGIDIIKDGLLNEAMVMLPKWKEMDLDEDNAPAWLSDIIAHRQVAGFPVKLNLAPPRVTKFF